MPSNPTQLKVPCQCGNVVCLQVDPSRLTRLRSLVVCAMCHENIDLIAKLRRLTDEARQARCRRTPVPVRAKPRWVASTPPPPLKSGRSGVRHQQADDCESSTPATISA